MNFMRGLAGYPLFFDPDNLNLLDYLGDAGDFGAEVLLDATLMWAAQPLQFFSVMHWIPD